MIKSSTSNQHPIYIPKSIRLEAPANYVSHIQPIFSIENNLYIGIFQIESIFFMDPLIISKVEIAKGKGKVFNSFPGKYSEIQTESNYKIKVGLYKTSNKVQCYFVHHNGVQVERQSYAIFDQQNKIFPIQFNFIIRFFKRTNIDTAYHLLIFIDGVFCYRSKPFVIKNKTIKL